MYVYGKWRLDLLGPPSKCTGEDVDLSLTSAECCPCCCLGEGGLEASVQPLCSTPRGAGFPSCKLGAGVWKTNAKTLIPSSRILETVALCL